MKMKRASMVALATAAALTLAACGGNGGSEEPDTDGTDPAPTDAPAGDFLTDLTFGTGGTAGTYYPLGGELAAIFEDNIDGLSVNYVESGGSGDNLGRIYNGEWQLGLTQNDTANLAVNGELADLEGINLDNIGWIAKLYPEAAHIVVRADSDIHSVADLAGKTIAVGDTGSGTRAISDAILEAHGIGADDYTPEITDFGTSTEMLGDNQIDATIFVVGTPVAGLTQLAATTDVRLLSVDQAAGDEVAANSGAEVYTISSDAYDFLDEDVVTMSVFAVLVASIDQVSPEIGYEITKAVFEHSSQITLEVGSLISEDEGQVGIGDIPLHPGAAEFYGQQ